MGLLDGLLGQVLSGALKPGQDDGRGLPDMGRTGGQGMGGLRVDPGRSRRRQPGAGPGRAEGGSWAAPRAARARARARRWARRAAGAR